MLVFICEDIKEHSEAFQKLLEELSYEMNWDMDMEIEAFDTAEELLEELNRRMENNENLPEVIFTDIEMAGMDGIALGKEICHRAPQIYLVFLTAFGEYAIRGYETRAYRYLLKPAKKEEILQIFMDIFKQKSKEKLLVVDDNDEERVISLHTVRYIKAEDKYIIVYTTEGEYLDRRSLQYYEDCLQKLGFFRIHRKYLVNMSYHKGLEGGYVILDNDEKLPISRRKVGSYRDCFLELLEGGMLK